MASAFHVKEHTVEAQHIREYPKATAHSQEEVLHLAVKQYIPKSNPNPQPGDITVIGAHANGFPKELYEPLWEDLVTSLGKKGIRVRGIWIADVAWQGQSAILNEDKIGNDPSWIDHARDLLHMINVFRKEMPRPLVGIGHSFGGNVIVNLSYLHPRLLSHLVLLDPVLSRFIKQGPDYGFNPMKMSSFRRDLWPSRQEAEAAFRKNKLFSTWDPRVLEAWLKYGIRDTPTKLYPEPGKATLMTTKHQEVFTYYRPLAQAVDKNGKRYVDVKKLPDIEPDYQTKYPDFAFYRPEGPTTTDKLPSLRPSVLWLYGGQSEVCSPGMREEKMKLTGVGVSGSGGAEAGMVTEVIIEEFGHLVPMEATTRCAAYAAESIVPAVRRWREEEDEFLAWAKKSDVEKQVLDDDFKGWIGPLKPAKGKL
ncbi:alpha/beta-hydrolase [Coniochaeta ligniaria NRRL 30616]|uniref:Alpha/beta-hydrolase n=1 Tax=Coniochaeta ligniaria NRRL 30616 TaxID=1408157 RepID=A0A1J7ICY0_9PEZI|nr:alpha/beta-hydrolase [Coniochaeta ligniaria NRRL 30616]